MNEEELLTIVGNMANQAPKDVMRVIIIFPDTGVVSTCDRITDVPEGDAAWAIEAIVPVEDELLNLPGHPC